MERAHVPGSKYASRAKTVLQEILQDYHPRDFAIELWDGSGISPDPGHFCRFTWHIHSPGVLRSLLRSDRQLALGEAYIEGGFDISGDILAIFPVAEHLSRKHFSAAEKLRMAGSLLGLPASEHPARPHLTLDGQKHSRTRDRAVVSFHYDLSNDFYRLWLDSEMIYSCAYFHSPEDNLNQAQKQKLDYLCRKLRLRRDERLLDIGCGWGGLILHAARNYGVHATGITLSEQQLHLARERIAKDGLSSHCEVRLLDYRDAKQLGDFDKVVSVGMVEHVGEKHLPDYFRAVFDVLKLGGVFLNHGIGRAGNRSRPSKPTFTDVYVFPDAELIPISSMLEPAECAGFEVRDLENLREHYFLTLVQWLRRLESRAQEARQLIGDTQYRIWRLYLAGSAYYFQSGKLDLYQTLMVKNGNGRSGLPLTRSDWY